MFSYYPDLDLFMVARGFSWRHMPSPRHYVRCGEEAISDLTGCLDAHL